ncbi:hypothetical protein [Brevibacillus sp. MER 51]|uniref:hypothetical protein n=1 Tax=Brevibacillus sp. MER 51 TaxID=2939560 RepID=UPI00203B2563|nr:hypothetical protein [Brevibacillus sp. MER 51]MCM3143064.1 hypothetical protein [Brevibacillus sp. MER 51]
MDLKAFREDGHGAVIQFVGRKDQFKSKEEFLEECLDEFEDELEEYEPEDLPAVADVKEGHCKYYSVVPEDVDIDMDSGYMLCDPSEDGSFEVYYIDLN